MGVREAVLSDVPCTLDLAAVKRGQCRAISNAYFNGQHRVVDVERGFFNLIQQGHLQLAQVIYAAA